MREKNESPGKPENPGSPGPQYLALLDLPALARVWPGPIDWCVRQGISGSVTAGPVASARCGAPGPSRARLPLVTFILPPAKPSQGRARKTTQSVMCLSLKHDTPRIYIKARPVPIHPGAGETVDGGLSWTCWPSSVGKLVNTLKTKKPVRPAELRRRQCKPTVLTS